MEISIGTLLSGINTTKGLLEFILSKKGACIEKKIIAVKLMQKAINSTEIYLVESNRNFRPNQTLSSLWLEAFTSMIPINKNLAGRLRDKSRFWANPQSWIREERAMELVPDLIELNDKCNDLLIELNCRK